MSRRQRIDSAREIRLWIRMICGAILVIRWLCPDLWKTIQDGISIAYYKVKTKIEETKAKMDQEKG